MNKQGRSICTTQNDNMSPTQISNGKNDSKINSEMSSTPSKVNLDKNRMILPVRIGEKNKLTFSQIPGQAYNNERKQSETSNLDLNGLDEIMNSMRKRIKSDMKNENMTNEKFKISRAINLLFKNNLSEFTINDLNNLNTKETLIPNKGENLGTINNLKDQNLSQLLSGSNKEKMLFTTVNETKSEKNPPVLTKECNQPHKIENSNTLLNKKRFSQSVQLNKNNEKVPRKCEKMTDDKLENLEKSKVILEEAHMILNKNILKIDSLSTDASISSADILTPNSNYNQTTTSNYLTDPITAAAYPTSINSEAHKTKSNSTSNVHFNINITNIVDSNNKIIQTLNTAFTSDQYAKIVSELKESLKKKDIIFNEQHSSTNYYKFVIDSATSKITRYEKSKEKEKLVEINNSEGNIYNEFLLLDCSERLIFHELITLKRELDLGKFSFNQLNSMR